MSFGHISDIVERMLNHHNLDEKSSDCGDRALEILRKFSASATIDSINNGVVVISVDSSVVLHELSMYKENILDAFKGDKIIASCNIKSIKFVMKGRK